MNFKTIALTACATCSVMSMAQSDFSISEPGSPRNGVYVKVSDFGLSRFHPTAEITDNNLRTYRPGRPVFGNLTFTTSVDLADSMIRWFNKVVDGKVDRKSMSVIFRNESEELARMNFFECWPTRMKLPACDAENPQPAGIEVALSSLGFERGDKPTEPQFAKQKQWLCSNFRIRIQGMDAATTRVNKIEAITIKQLAFIGGDLDGDGSPDYTVSDLVFTMPAQDCTTVTRWFDNGGTRNATLSYLDGDGTVMSEINLRIACGEIGVDPLGKQMTVRCHVTKLVWSPRSN